MGLFDERIPYKPFEYPEYYNEGWLDKKYIWGVKKKRNNQNQLSAKI